MGSAIVRQLLDKEWSVVTLQRGDYPYLREWGAETVQGDLREAEIIEQAAKGCDVIFHVAAKAGVWGDEETYYQSNVGATENIISCCKKLSIQYLVYTSSPSVVFDGTSEIGINESTQYPDQYFNAYQRTKAEAEQNVIAVNSSKLKTVILRPHLIWGPDDPHLVPRVIERAKAGKLKLVGDGQNKVDSCYIDNAAYAHILAAETLIKTAKCAGKVYFISNDEPIAMAELINKILTAANLPVINKKMSPALAYIVGFMLEKVYALLKIKQEPIMTRFVAKQLSTSHWFDLTAAKQDLGYLPTVNIEQGMLRLKQSLQSD